DDRPFAHLGFGCRAWVACVRQRSEYLVADSHSFDCGLLRPESSQGLTRHGPLTNAYLRDGSRAGRHIPIGDPGFREDAPRNVARAAKRRPTQKVELK